MSINTNKAFATYYYVSKRVVMFYFTPKSEMYNAALPIVC